MFVGGVYGKTLPLQRYFDYKARPCSFMYYQHFPKNGIRLFNHTSLMEKTKCHLSTLKS